MRFVQSCTAAAGCLTLEPLSPVVGAEVQHFDLVAALDADDPAALAARLRAALDEHGLLLFRDQRDLTPEHHVRTARLFGSVFPLPPRFQHERSPAPTEILRMSNDAAEGFAGVGASGWHIDGTSYEAPFPLALMRIVHAFPERSGPTLFLPMAPLAERVRRRAPAWERLWVRNGAGTHPLLFRGPRGQVGVCLGKAKSFAWDLGGPGERATDADETAALLAALDGDVAAVAGDGGVYRHEWRTGDLLVVDNVAVAHLAAPETQTPRDVAGLRVLDRVVVAGVAGRDALAPLGGEAPRLVG